MNPHFHAPNRIQTYIKTVERAPFPQQVQVFARNLTTDDRDVLLGTGRSYSEALARAGEKVAEDYPGFTM